MGYLCLFKVPPKKKQMKKLLEFWETAHATLKKGGTVKASTANGGENCRLWKQVFVLQTKTTNRSIKSEQMSEIQRLTNSEKAHCNYPPLSLI